MADACVYLMQNYDGDVFLGGDHSITYSLFKSLKSNNKGLIIFDAHVDLDNYTETPTHEDFLRKLIDENHLNPNNLIIHGNRFTNISSKQIPLNTFHTILAVFSFLKIHSIATKNILPPSTGPNGSILNKATKRFIMIIHQNKS